jgi:hypothetical protein
MVTSPFNLFATTPEQPPGQATLAPLLVNRSSNGLEMSIQLSAAWDGVVSHTTRQQARRRSITVALGSADLRVKAWITPKPNSSVVWHQHPLFSKPKSPDPIDRK